MNVPEELLYTKDHEWIKIDNNNATIGVTDYAQSELGDIIFIEFPDKDISFKTGDTIGTIEAVKTVADIFTPLDGQIAEINKNLVDTPEMINHDPYKNGWILKLRNISIKSSNLLSASDYKRLIQ